MVEIAFTHMYLRIQFEQWKLCNLILFYVGNGCSITIIKIKHQNYSWQVGSVMFQRNVVKLAVSSQLTINLLSLSLVWPSNLISLWYNDKQLGNFREVWLQYCNSRMQFFYYEHITTSMHNNFTQSCEVFMTTLYGTWTISY